MELVDQVCSHRFLLEFLPRPVSMQLLARLQHHLFELLELLNEIAPGHVNLSSLHDVLQEQEIDVSSVESTQDL